MLQANAKATAIRRSESACKGYYASHTPDGDPRIRLEMSLWQNWLEQFDGVPRRVVDNNLVAAKALYYIVSKMGSRLAQRRYGGVEDFDFDRESVPPSRLLIGPIEHRLAAACLWVRLAKHQTEVASFEHSKRGGWVHNLAEAEMLAVEPDRSINIVDNVAHLNCGHSMFLSTHCLRCSLKKLSGFSQASLEA